VLNPHHTDPVFWEKEALDKETQRVLEICHGCRRCWNLCPSFGNVFKRIDQLEDQINGSTPSTAAVGSADGLYDEGAATADPSLALAKDPVAALTDDDHEKLVDECYQCKLCFNLCPYHPPHRYQLDFPRLMQRQRAVRGGRFIDRILSNVDLLGRMASYAAPIANFFSSLKFPRPLLGIHRERNLPQFHTETFRRWWDWRGPKGERKEKVALFYTCSVNYNFPSAGKAAVAVLEKNGLEVVAPEQLCCGMPKLDCGDIEGAKASARKNIEKLLPLAQKGVPILALGPACSLMIRDEWPSLLRSEDSVIVAKNTYDVCEYLVKLKRAGKLNTNFKNVGTIAYQVPCHLKAQNIGYKSKEILELLGPGLAMIDRCSAHDGTWSMKQEYFDLSLKTAKKMFDELEQAGADRIATDCPLAGLQIEKGLGKKPVHPVELVAEAYGL
jgi:Fe-S oxidoreductase